MRRISILVFTALLAATLTAPLTASAQRGNLPLTEQQLEQVRAELEKRNITEAELLARLKEKDIDLQEIPREELPMYQDIIIQTVLELEMEKRMDRDRAQEGVRLAQPRPTPSPPDVIAEDTVEAVVEVPDPHPIYGHALFAEDRMEVFRTTEGARAPDTYILGPGDQLRITIFGVSQADLLMEINREGYVRPGETAQMYLKGLSIAQAHELLRRRLSQFYTFRPDQFSLTIHTARTITVNVFGEARVRGSFTLSALNTAFNALYATGGPTPIGSVRNIQHIRGNVRKTLDVYAFMNDPALQFDFDLQHNDIIYIPVAEKLVQIEGAVKRPMRYELKAGEGLLELITFAGGINYDTYPEFVQVRRVEEGEVTLTEYNLAEALRGSIRVEIQDGDIVRLRQITRPLERFVEIDGSVFYPGNYNLQQNPSLDVLLQQAQLRPQAKTDLLFIERWQPDESIRIIPVEWDALQQAGEDFPLEARDKVMVFDRERYRSLATIRVLGSVRDSLERRLPYDERISLANALSLAGGAIPSAAETAYVIRTNLMNPDEVEHIRVNLVHDWGFQLQPGDDLFVYSRETYTNIPEISVQGAVNSPFSTTFEPGLQITDLLKMAGGLTERAELSRVDVFRLNLHPTRGTRFDLINLEVDEAFNLTPEHDTFRLMPYDQVVVRQIPLFDVDRSAELSGQVLYPGAYLLGSRRIHLSDLIDEAGGLTQRADARHATLIRSFENTGPIGINLQKALANRGRERYDPAILGGDIITIPEFHNVFNVRLEATRLGELAARDILPDETFVPGAQRETVSFVYQGPRSARWYIQNFAGGFSADADRRSVTVTRRNGQVVGTKRRLLLFNSYPTVEPGSTISLAYEPPEPERDEPRIDWERMQQRSLTAATTLLTLIAIIDRISR